MKKIFKALIAAGLAVLMIFACAACSGEASGGSGLVGTWNLQIDRSQFPSMTEAEASATEAYLSTLKFTINFNADGTATVSGTFGTNNSDANGTVKWTQNGDKVVLTPTEASNTNSMTMTLRDGKLWFEEATVGADAAKMMYLAK